MNSTSIILNIWLSDINANHSFFIFEWFFLFLFRLRRIAQIEFLFLFAKHTHNFGSVFLLLNLCLPLRSFFRKDCTNSLCIIMDDASHHDTVFFNCTSCWFQISLDILSASEETLLGLSNSFIPVLRWLWISINIKLKAIHQGDVSLSVPVDAGVSILAIHVVAINLILLHNGEQWLVSSKAYTSELIVIPLFIVHILDVAVLISTECFAMQLCTIFAYKHSQPDEAMCGKILLAIKAIFVVWVL